MAAAHKLRSKLYRKAHGAPAEVFEAAAGSVTIEAFELDFSPDEDDEDAGYVLLTNGMSDRRMHLDADARTAVADGRVKERAELAWYVRDLQDAYIDNLFWLTEFPFIDETWLGFGHTVIMPAPILPSSALMAFFLLGPILGLHKRLADKLRVDKDPVELLVVHLLTAEEYALKRSEGANAILDLFDANDYPLVVDPKRMSFV
jgi:hypothetical protein